MSRFSKALLLGCASAILGLMILFLFAGFDLEEGLGLDTLFRLRGPQPAPQEVLIVAIDKSAADALGLPNDPSKWPRDLHARLIDKLSKQGAAVIAFDIFFKEARDPAQDETLAAAIQRAGNVLLFAHLKREILEIGSPADPQAFNLERLVPPTPIIATAPVALAPFALLKYPLKVTRFWTFRVPAGEIPNMPAMTLQLFAMDQYAALQRLATRTSPDKPLPIPATAKSALAEQGLSQLLSDLRTYFRDHPEQGHAMLAQLQEEAASQGTELDLQRQKLIALLKMYLGPNQHYLNFYGPPRSIQTISYHDALADTSSIEVKNKVVFIGFSARLQPEQKDNFYTVFSQPTGLDLSGVEIGATAFANLLHDRTIKSPGAAGFIALIIGFGIYIALAARLPRPILAILITLCAALVYLLISYQLFREQQIWLPIVIPLLIQLPFALFAGILWHYIETHRERQRIRQAFGYYLPNNVVNQLANNSGHPEAGRELMYGICLATDASQYTRLSESMAPEALGQLMDRYYAQLFEPVRRHGGIVSDVIGDAMLAIWSANRSEASLRSHACAAALEIVQTVEKLRGPADDKSPQTLPTRIGLHAGQLLLGNVGALDHYEYRAVGDIVNTANRIEGMNKYLGTTLLASAQALQGVEGFMTRELGTFQLSGKQQAITLYEILARLDEVTQAMQTRCERFAEGLRAYRSRQWLEAKEHFFYLCSHFPTDKPPCFYLELIQQHAENPPQGEWEGIIRMESK